MCTLLSVSRSAYYDWLNGPVSPRALEDAKLLKQIRDIFLTSKCCYGARRICAALRNAGHRISRSRVSRLMKLGQLFCKVKRKFRVTTDSKHDLPIAPNLLNRQFSAAQPNQKYVGDITYIWTNEGWLYLAVVIDLFSRRVVGYAIDKTMTAELVNYALSMAIWQRKPPKGLIWHTDRGSQYASKSHRKLLKAHGIKQSMSRKGNCWDNAPSESFFHSLKTECTYHLNFKKREEAKQAIFEYIQVFYNRKRLHSTNNYLSPNDYEVMMNAA